MARDLEGTVNQAKTTMANVHNTTSTLNEDLKAAQSNFLLKGFFNKKKKAAKAKRDSISNIKQMHKDSVRNAKNSQKAQKDSTRKTQ